MANIFHDSTFPTEKQKLPKELSSIHFASVEDLKHPRPPGQSRKVLKATDLAFKIVKKSPEDSQLTAFLDVSLDQIVRLNNVQGCMDELCFVLNNTRLKMEKKNWLEHIDKVRRHPIFNVIQQDPCTRRCFEKPRGYAGDAKMLDYLYRLSEHKLNSDVGCVLLEYTQNSPAGQAVRDRSKKISEYVQSLVSVNSEVEILSVAAGHLREMSFVHDLNQSRIKRYVALDQDVKSLQFIQNTYGHLGIEGVQSDLISLIKNSGKYGTFDFIYSSGLYDYLSDKLAAKLTSVLLGMLKKSGTLLITNFSPYIRDIGYMETFMDWHLIYRSDHAFNKISPEVDMSNIQKRLFTDTTKNVVFLELKKI